MCHSRNQIEMMNLKFRKDCGTFITRAVWALGFGVWIRWWDVVNMIQSRGGVLCYPLWWLWVSMLLMNANIDDDILWLRAVVVRTFHHTDCVSLCGRCLDPVMGCREYDPNLGGGYPLWWIWISVFLMTYCCDVKLWSCGHRMSMMYVSRSSDWQFLMWWSPAQHQSKASSITQSTKDIHSYSK